LSFARADGPRTFAGVRRRSPTSAGNARATQAKALTNSGRLTAFRTRFVRFPSKRLRPGKYVYSIRIRAEASAKRSVRLTSRKFVVFAPRHR